MHHEEFAFTPVQRLTPQPREQLQSVVGGKNVLNGVFRPKGDNAFGGGEQEEIVVS